jgi:predicted RNA-binding Zn ribbon-like protein
MEPRLVGGHIALDLVNTVAPRVPGGVEYIGTPAELLAWARRVDLVTDDEAEEIRAAWDGAAALRATMDIREAAHGVLTAALDSGLAPPSAELRRLSGHWTDAAARSALEAGGPGGPPARLAVGTVPAMRIPDRLAAAVVDLLQTIDLDRVRVCPLEEGGCGWLFLDRSRNGSRRWCAMADCGTQAKSRRLTERRRATRGTAGGRQGATAG